MNIRFKNILILAVLAILSCALVGCVGSSAEGKGESVTDGESIESEESSEYVFYGTVTETESDFGEILVKPESKILPRELVVHSSAMPALNVGERVKVEYNGQITLSLPGQIFGAKVTVAE